MLQLSLGKINKFEEKMIENLQNQKCPMEQQTHEPTRQVLCSQHYPPYGQVLCSRTHESGAKSASKTYETTNSRTHWKY